MSLGDMEHIVVTGTIRPNEEADFEENQVCIVTDDDEVYQVMQNRVGKNLACHLDMRVEAEGNIKEDYFSDRVISIEKFKLLK